ncbi:proto-oncogene tyrosine-protein kinase ROS-like isoform X2 [Nylanderia fulva]|uniref:proto-oncogene tyrosine-protein kinase ROS-like isoform X2 n=1 Tax=Nylanderia fulva TaxID=613905 RepID=UPI0010FB0D68|nr:proto-oncogene tyrosine-protein kinase ROS-like isoform X2 [Nylanderia fulva]
MLYSAPTLEACRVICSLNDMRITLSLHGNGNSCTNLLDKRGHGHFTYMLLQESSILESIPSEPTSPRAFVEFGNRLTEKDIFVTFRWNEPKVTIGKIQKYSVQYWFEDLNQTIKIINIFPLSNRILQHKICDLKPNTTYYFKVRAHNKFGAGPYTKCINVSTTHENPIPLLLEMPMDIQSVNVLDIDFRIGFKLPVRVKYKEIVYSALEHKIYGITDNSELITSDFNQNEIKANLKYTNITKLDVTANNLCIDWIRRNLYWLQIKMDNLYIMKLDLTLWEQMSMNKSDEIITKSLISSRIYSSLFLVALPYTRYLYWSELNSDKNENIIMQSDFNGKNIKSFLEDHICQYKLELSSSMQIDTTNVDKPLMYWILENNLFVTNINGSKCNLILRATNKTYFDDLTIDKINIYLYNNFDKIIYIIKKRYALLESKENAFESVEKINMQGINTNMYHRLIALDKSLQLYPPTICLTPKMEEYRVEKVLLNANSIEVSLPEPILNVGCKKYNLATTIYHISVSYLTCLDNDSIQIEHFTVKTYERHYEIQNLTPFTEYTLKLALSNFYANKLLMSLLQFGSNVILKTIPGKLNAPEDVTVQVLTPTLAIIHWMPPKKLNCVAVNYEVYWLLFPNSTKKISYQLDKKLINKPNRTVNGKLFTIIKLLPRHNYQIYVRVYPTNFSHLFEDSLIKTVYMSEPNNLNLNGVSTNSMNISWISSINLTIHTKFRSILEYKNDTMREWQIANNSERNNNTITYYIKNLLPRTVYNFRLILRYPEYMNDFVWPEKGFNFETLGNVPSAPGILMVTKLPNLTYQLNWEPAQAHNSPVILYRLEGLIIKNNYKESNQTDKSNYWNLYYNGTDNYWITTRYMNQKYRFRVQAKNAYGFGKWSESRIVDLTESMEILILQYIALILSLVATIVICNVYYFYCSYREKNKRVNLSSTSNIELITNYKKFYGNNSETNPVHDSKLQHDRDAFARIGIIKINKIILEKFLGSGAFGEVYQGTVKNFKDSDRTVAIKMLPDNATSQQEYEFLKEATLMSDFDHKHILKIFGICVDMSSPWLILELMEADDLLTYLKKSRTLVSSNPHALRLQDLLAMCEDIARGCRYLEEQHFVHRDLACRNCLISARDREHRIVKIGGFGLTRDIYEKDYYRMQMEGRTPLPIRWLAPESLRYRKFTSRSDVWAFGVVMWEITSLGRMPYFDKNNIEVCQFVCTGNTLSKPLDCPPELYQLMLKCWNVATKRPKFKHCFEIIEILRNEIEDAMLSSMNIIRHVQNPRSEAPDYLQIISESDSRPH